MALRIVARTLSLTACAGLVMLVVGTGLTGAESAGTAPVGKLDAPALAKIIDQGINAKLKSEKVEPSGRCDDAEFLRRVYLDLIGKIPTTEATNKFLASTDPDKRAKIVDELLANSDYGRHQADLWVALMVPRNSDNRRLTYDPFVKWVEKKFNENTSWNTFVTEILTANGTQTDNGAVTFFLANNTVDKMTDSVGKLFLGLQLQCAQCHPHPFTEWKQTQYWETAAFFMKVQVGNVNKAAKDGTSPGISESALPKRGKNGLPESAKLLPPKFLDGKLPTLKAGEEYRPHLAKWVCSGENPFFARSMVNRVWHQLFGRGFVNPVDDIRDENDPTHPELFTVLSRQFVENGFDVKFLFKTICLTETYQRTSKPNQSNRDADSTLFARMNIKVLSPEQLFDSYQVIFGPVRENGKQEAKPLVKGQAPGARAAFVTFFNLDETWDTMEFQAGIPQVLRMMNSAMLNNPAKAADLTRGATNPTEAIEKLYIAVLSRKPTAVEVKRALEYVTKVGDPKQAQGDLFWVLVNCSEFALNH